MLQLKSLSSTQKDLLTAVHAFSPIQRYHGLMPKHVASIFTDEDIQAAELIGLISWETFTTDYRGERYGLRLTDKGRRMLESICES